MTFTASYRVQLRDGFDFDAARARVPQIADLGVSHLYLSPVLTAAPGSTHGYDVTDPTTIDPALGGAEGFERLSQAAQDAGLKVILDIVPNHMAFGLDTPWLVDVLRHGTDSPHASVFDIDWDAGPLALPWLTEPIADTFERGAVRIDGDMLDVDGLRVPLAPGPQPEALDADTLSGLLDAQPWRLLPWQLERDSITHRRFFSVTDLIGVRVEDEAVFDATHTVVVDLARRGLIHGLRVDHVDGLVDPDGYLRRLANAVPDIPVWVEKILVTGETLPDWPTAGTTGYEAAADIARVLTDADGLRRLDALWRDATGLEGDFHSFVEAAKREVLTDELAAELRQLRGMGEALGEAEEYPVGPEMLREAMEELLVAFPRYRSYIADGVSEDDAALWRGAAERGAANVRSGETIDWLVERILPPRTDEARRLALRLQQVTGALIAKAHEDTAGFRFNRYLAANEVGADPDRPVADPWDVSDGLSQRLRRQPHALTLGSSHDTKRSEDARARLIAATHAPGEFAWLWRDAQDLPQSDAIDPNRRYYALQTALCLWGEAEAPQRVADHLVKALREGKEVSYWTNPDEAREKRLGDWSRALLVRWDDARPEALRRIVALGEALSLRELGLRLLWPGMPDIYQGGEGALFQLTDPDNRRAPDWDGLSALPTGGGLSSRKCALLRAGLALRGADPDLFAHGEALWEEDGRDFVRRHEGREVRLAMGREVSGAAWSDDGGETGLALSLIGPG